MLKVNYITRPWFFDISVEFIRAFKQQVDLTVMLIIAPENAGYLGLSDAETASYAGKTAALEQVLKGEAYRRLIPYFEGARVICKFEQHKESSPRNALGWHRLLRENPMLLQADLHMIETLSLADWYFLLRLRNKKIYYIIHDPQPHTGEGRGRVEMINRLYFPYIQRFITYSSFSTGVFKQHYPKYADKVLTFSMPVFSSQKIKVPQRAKAPGKKIVFFGRISAYKGVELFYQAAAAISKTNPDIHFVIAGKAQEGYAPDFLNHNPYPNIQIHNHFIGLEALAELMADADLCVLPYFDATQSGVIMTCYAFNLPVLVSDCPGLLEYCFDRDHFSFKNKSLDSLIAKIGEIITHKELLAENRRQIMAYVSQNVSLLNSNLIISQFYIETVN